MIIYANGEYRSSTPCPCCTVRVPPCCEGSFVVEPAIVRVTFTGAHPCLCIPTGTPIDLVGGAKDIQRHCGNCDPGIDFPPGHQGTWWWGTYDCDPLMLGVLFYGYATAGDPLTDIWRMALVWRCNVEGRPKGCPGCRPAWLSGYFFESLGAGCICDPSPSIVFSSFLAGQSGGNADGGSFPADSCGLCLMDRTMFCAPYRFDTPTGCFDDNYGCCEYYGQPPCPACTDGIPNLTATVTL